MDGEPKIERIGDEDKVLFPSWFTHIYIYIYIIYTSLVREHGTFPFYDLVFLCFCISGSN